MSDPADNGDEWDSALADEPASGESTPKQSGSDHKQPEPVYSGVEAWVTGWLAPLITRDLTRDHAWCPEWWRHGEAVLRLEALWRSWEQARLEPTTGMSSWIRDHLDHHLPLLLTRATSPFAFCGTDNEHQPPPPQLPVQPAPAGWWGTETTDENPSTPARNEVTMEPNQDGTYTAHCTGCDETTVVDGGNELDEFEAGHIGCLTDEYAQ